MSAVRAAIRLNRTRSGFLLAASAAFRCTGSLAKAAFGLKVPKVDFVRVVSTGRRNTGFKFLSGRLVLQGLSGPLVELACDSAEFGLATVELVPDRNRLISKSMH